MQKNPPQLGSYVAFCHSIRLWLALVCLSFAGFSTPARAGDSLDGSQSNLTLVELYTSQGCSSCPPADAFLKTLTERADVLALSFHVDYWDTDLWQDPFSSPSFSLRQRKYQGALSSDYIYTPQVIVNGGFAAPGGQRDAILEAIDTHSSDVRPALSIQRRDAGGVEITVSETGTKISASLYVAVFNSSKVTRISGGENRGRTLTNVNVVRRLIQIAKLPERGATFQFSLSDLDAAIDDGVAVFIQEDGNGHVLAASAVMPPESSQTQVSLNSQPGRARSTAALD